jgi:hypothetical protein
MRRPDNVKLVASVFSQDTCLLNRVSDILEDVFGETDFKSRVMDFTHTEYYRKEMGGDLKRVLLSFKKPVRPDLAYKAKIKTNAIERRFARSGKRRVNIDPGYIDLSKLVLFSTKDYTHRIPISGGIFAETTLFYRDNRYNPWPWTYPDYASKEFIDMFESMRNLYKESL